MTLIAISGAQGQGKSTVLKSLTELGYNVIPQKTSRSILNDWGFTLNQVNSVKFLTCKFQEEVLYRHHKIIEDKISSNEIYFQERSMADIFSYCLNILGPFNEYNEWIDDYYNRCKALQHNYKCVIYLSGRVDYKPEDDGVRSINTQFSKAIDLLIKHYVDDFDNGNVLYIDTPNHNERIEIIRNHIKGLVNE